MSLFLLMLRLPHPMAQRAIGLKDLLRRDYGLNNWAYDAARLHVTLFELGHDMSPERLALVGRVASSMATPPFEVEFNLVKSWPDALVLLGDDKPTSLTAFRRDLGTALKRVWPEALRPSGFTPHITLMRGATFVEEQQVVTLLWTVTDFVFVHSVDGRYIELGRWLLASTPPERPG